MNPFDLEKALAGYPLITRDGRKVLDFHYFKEAVVGENKNLAPIFCFTESYGITQHTVSGNYWNKNIENPNLDLFLATTKKTYWVNVYKNCTDKIVIGEIVHLTIEDAMDTTKYRHEKIKTITFEVEK